MSLVKTYLDKTVKNRVKEKIRSSLGNFLGLSLLSKTERNEKIIAGITIVSAKVPNGNTVNTIPIILKIMLKTMKVFLIHLNP